jgi:eukaryotic-like serine/threonine-protein kinase
MVRTPEAGGLEAMRINLTVKAGPHEGQVFEFKERANFIVGRSERANFRLAVKDNSISRIHFMIEMNPPECRLTDMESTNGTRVNGRKVATADLKDGDLITAGKTTLLVSVIGSDEPMMSSTGTIPTAEATSFDALLQPRPHAVRIAAPAGQPLATADYPPRPRPAKKAPRDCRLCGDGLVETKIGASGSGEQNPTLDAVWLCPACRGRIGNHPQPIPGYQVVCELGRGGMGVVYQAVRTADGELVAIKTIKPAVDPTPVEIDRFLREARILSELDHPNIVSFHELGESNGLLYFAMDHVAGTDAAQLLTQYGSPLPIARAVDLVCQLLRALDYAHAKGFVHLDVKPSNMLVTQEGDRDVVRLSDFGLARIYLTSKMSGLSSNDQGGGTAPFMAPEQINDPRTTKPSADQYSAAATLYNFLTDRYIYDFPKKLHAKIMKILLEDPMPIRDRCPDLPEGLAAIIHRALARDPLARYANVREMRRALLPFVT